MPERSEAWKRGWAAWFGATGHEPLSPYPAGSDEDDEWEAGFDEAAEADDEDDCEEDDDDDE